MPRDSCRAWTHLRVSDRKSVVPCAARRCCSGPALRRRWRASACSRRAAAAATTIRFNNGGPGPASIVVSDNRTTRDGYIELVRGREVVARSLGSRRDRRLERLSDRARPDRRRRRPGLRQRRRHRRGRPTTAGRGSAPTRAPGARRSPSRARADAPAVWVGAYLPAASSCRISASQWADAASFTVAAEPALVAGQILRVLTRRQEGPVEVESRTRRGVIGACPPRRRPTRRCGPPRGAPSRPRARSWGRWTRADWRPRDGRAAVRVLRGGQRLPRAPGSRGRR